MPYVWMPPPLPGSGRFRAQAFGELLDRVFALYRGGFVWILALSAILNVPLALARLLYLPEVTNSIFQAPSQSTAANNTFMYASLFSVAEFFLVVPVTTAMVAMIVSRQFLDEKPSMAEAVSRTVSRLPQIILYGLASGILFYGANLIALMLWLATGDPGLELTLGLVGNLIFGIIFVRLQLGIPALMLEDTGPINALSRAWMLTRLAFWRIAGIDAVLLLVQFVVASLLTGMVAALTGGITSASISAAVVSGIVLEIFFSPTILIATTLLYYDQRIRNEAFDIEKLADAL